MNHGFDKVEAAPRKVDEVDATPRRVGLYYRFTNQEHATSLLLKIGKHNKNLIMKIKSKLVNIPIRRIPGIKLKFRKQVLNYNSGYGGTRQYFDLGLCTKGMEEEKRNREEIVKKKPQKEI